MPPIKDLAPTRWTLLERLKDAEDSASWQEFFDSYWKLIHSLARKAGLTEAEAQEVVQEVVIGVARKMPGFECDPARGSFKSWLLQVTRRRIIDQFRKRQPWSPTQAPDSLRSPVGPVPAGGNDGDDQTATIEKIADPAGEYLAQHWEVEWREKVAERAIEWLRQTSDAEQFQMFDLHVRAGMPAREVARRLGVTLTRVYLAKYRLTLALKRQVRRLAQGV